MPDEASPGSSTGPLYVANRFATSKLWVTLTYGEPLLPFSTWLVAVSGFSARIAWSNESIPALVALLQTMFTLSNSRASFTDSPRRYRTFLRSSRRLHVSHGGLAV